MSYSKPEVSQLNCADKAIQGNNGKPSFLFLDSKASTILRRAATPAAYEADE